MLRVISIFLIIVLIQACDTNNKFTDMSDSELRRQRSVCKSIKKKSPGKAIACENVEKEYKRRIKERSRG